MERQDDRPRHVNPGAAQPARPDRSRRRRWACPESGVCGGGGGCRVQPGEPEAFDRHGFFGTHQSGIVTAQPAAALVAAFDVLANARDGLVALLRRLTARVAALMEGETDGLSVTVALGAAMFDSRFGLAAQRPKRLMAMTTFPNDALECGRCHGDLLIQFNANCAETNARALRAVLQDAPTASSCAGRRTASCRPERLGRRVTTRAGTFLASRTAPPTWTSAAPF